uniref:Uncharacterized protein n=1 Tax=Arundo donax TaxID=35708 RepID=A0A0A9CDX6_ARUDO
MLISLHTKLYQTHTKTFPSYMTLTTKEIILVRLPPNLHLTNQMTHLTLLVQRKRNRT